MGNVKVANHLQKLLFTALFTNTRTLKFKSHSLNDQTDKDSGQNRNSAPTLRLVYRRFWG